MRMTTNSEEETEQSPIANTETVQPWEYDSESEAWSNAWDRSAVSRVRNYSQMDHDEEPPEDQEL
jgi:hypothetical protein